MNKIYIKLGCYKFKKIFKIIKKFRILFNIIFVFQ